MVEGHGLFCSRVLREGALFLWLVTLLPLVVLAQASGMGADIEASITALYGSDLRPIELSGQPAAEGG